MVRRTRVGRSPRGRNPSIRVQIPASPCLIFRTAAGINERARSHGSGGPRTAIRRNWAGRSVARGRRGRVEPSLPFGFAFHVARTRFLRRVYRSEELRQGGGSARPRSVGV